MKKKKYYDIFYDEAFHDRKITANEGELNIENQELSDTFVTAVIGTLSYKTADFENRFVNFESYARSTLDLNEGKEFKGTTIKKKFFKYGIASFSNDALHIYDQYFDLITNDLIIQMSFLSKFELVVTTIFKSTVLPEYVMQKEFYYSLIKFLNQYRNKQTVSVLFNVESTTEDILCEITDLMNKVFNEIKDIKRKELEKEAIWQMLLVINFSRETIRSHPASKIEWNYHKAFDGVDLLLDELSIPKNRVNLIIDNEVSTENAAKERGYKSVRGVKSHESIGVRYTDILSNFMGRMIKAIEDEYEEDWDKQETIEKLSERRILSDKWFDISNDDFQLYKK